MPEHRPKNRRRNPHDMDMVCGTSAVEVRGSPTSATGTGWERTPWHATQRAGGVGRAADGQYLTDAKSR